ncbi:hypothetical protein K501DRAFT_144691, partial [Backusella circina FSU 941]
DVAELTELYLPCPRSGRRSVYLSSNNNQLYDIQKVTGPGRKSAWLVASHIYKDGAVRMITLMDPLFMALPLLERFSRIDTGELKYRTLDDIFSSDYQHIDVHRLANISNIDKQLAHLCDTKEIAPELYVYRINEELVMEWLVKKVNILVNSPVFIKHVEKVKGEYKKDLIKLEAVYTLANYLSKKWFNKLLNKLNIQEIEEEDLIVYRDEVPLNTYFKRTLKEPDFAPEKVSTTPRSLAKVKTTGMKSLSNYFTVK